jgi:hypothetical protein
MWRSFSRVSLIGNSRRMSFMKKGICWTFLTITLLVGMLYLLRGPIITLACRQVLLPYLPKANISLSDFQWKRGKCVLKDFVIASKESEWVRVERVECDLNIRLSPMRIRPKIALEGVEIQAVSGAGGPGSLQKLRKTLAKQQVVDLAIARGVIHFDENTPDLTFAFEPSCLKGHLGTIRLAEESILIDLFARGRDIYTKLLLSDTDMASLSKVIQFFQPDWEYEVYEGVLSGSFELGIHKKRVIDHLRFSLRAGGLRGRGFSAEEISLGMHLPLEGAGSTKARDISMSTFFSQFITMAEVKKGEASFLNPATGKRWKIDRFDGLLDGREKKFPTFKGAGIALFDGVGLPVEIAAHGELGDDIHFSMDVDFLHRNEGGLASVGVTFGGRSKQFECDLSEISGLELTMVQDIARNFTDLPLQVDSGIVSGICQGIYESGRVLAVDVRSFDLRGLCGAYANNRFAIEQVRGKGTYNYCVPVVIDGVVRGATFQTPYGEMTNLMGSFKSDCGSIYDTSIWGSWQGVDFDAHLDGSFNDLKLHTHVTLHDKFPFIEEWQKAKKSYSELQPIKEIVSSVSLRNLHNGWEAEGSFLLAYADAQTDKMNFRVVTAGEHLRDVIAKREVSGSFWGDEVSHHLYAIPLGVSQDAWQLRGVVDVKGEFDESGLELSIQPGALQFTSNELDLSVTDLAGISRLHWDFARGEWRGRFGVREASGIQKPFALEFSAISADVELCGQVLEARNVSAVCEGVDLGGYLTFDFNQIGVEELQISIDSVDGDSSHVQKLLRHFDEMSELDIPISGRVVSEGSSWITVQNGELSCEFLARLKEGAVQLAEGLNASDLTFHLGWDSRTKIIEIKDFEGQLLLAESGDSYALSAKYFRCVDIENLFWEFDLRAATATYDILRLVGTGQKEGDLFNFAIDREYSHFYKGKLDVDTFTMNFDFTPKFLQFRTEMGVADFAFSLDFLAGSGALPMKEGMVAEFQSANLQGNIEIDVQIDAASGDLACELTGVDVPFRFSFDKKAESIEVKKFRLGLIEGEALLQKKEGGWEIPKLRAAYGMSSIALQKGHFDPEKKQVHLAIGKMRADLSEIKECLLEDGMPYMDHLAGKSDLLGDIQIDFSKGWRAWEIHSNLSFSCDAFGKGKTQVQSRFPFSLDVNAERQVSLSNAKFKCSECEDDEVWSEIDVADLHITKGKIVGKGVKVMLPPEMALHFAKHGFFPNLQVDKNILQVGETPVVWENQLSTEFDFTYTNGVCKAHGILQEGYYWLGDRSWLLKDFAFNFYGDRLRLTSQVQFADFVFDLSSVVSFGSDISGQVSISECVAREDLRPLAIFFRWNQDHGITLQGAEGSLYGVSIDLHHNPRVYLPKQMILSGSIGLDSDVLLEIFPDELKHRLKQLEIGKGYELSGDLILSMDNIIDVRFKGYLKGRDFELFGCQLKTLLSEIEVCRTQVLLRNFRLSDEGGVFLAKEIRTSMDEEKSWKVHVPEVVIQDFRPSLIKHVGSQRGSLRPFVVKDLRFCNIEGDLADPESFTGRGYLDFYNTFKRDFNLLDIPFEIIGRLGLDLTLFIPVKGRVDYQMREGKIFLTSLTESYSDGERSKFYFPENKEIYIGLDGSLLIDLKMKQYVLLKITEPFTVSVRGSLTKPRYSLR